jgi:hypothetical protein
VIAKSARYAVELVNDNEIERRLHDLTLDFGVIGTLTVSRPLQVHSLRAWRLNLWVPRDLYRTEKQALRAWEGLQLPLAIPVNEPSLSTIPEFAQHEPRIACSSFLEAEIALKQGGVATVLPDYFQVDQARDRYHPIKSLPFSTTLFHHALAWNPRLIRLNPHANRQKDFLIDLLKEK